MIYFVTVIAYVVVPNFKVVVSVISHSLDAFKYSVNHHVGSTVNLRHV